jgi:mannosyltransferase
VSEPSSRCIDTLLLLLILALAAILRFYQLDGSSMWSDEGNTWALVQRSATQIARDAASDIHPPGYYWLLKGWTTFLGLSVWSLRAFSATAGLLLVVVTAAIARLAAPAGGARRWMPLLAAFIAAVNPFQVYYSQEARMYMVLALLAATLFWLLMKLLRAEQRADGRASWWLAAGYTLVLAIGVWSHYIFPVVALAAAIVWAIDWWRRLRRETTGGSAMLRFGLANGAALLLFSPWLPTALRQVASWPQGGERLPLWEGMILTLRTLLLGMVRVEPTPFWPWLLAAALLPIAGAYALRREQFVTALLLWMAAPLLLMAGLGLFSDAFLKFLLVISVPWSILVAASAEVAGVRTAPWLRTMLALGALVFAWLTLPGYYQDATARDNYKGIAALVAAYGDPQQDLVLLNAPGQSDVWQIYDPGMPVLALPTTRPPDAEGTRQALTAALEGVRSVYALYWATDEADPDRVVERYLDQTLFRGVESWQGNVRFVRYENRGELVCESPDVEGAILTLERLCLPPGETIVAPGESALAELHWRVTEQPTNRWITTLQLLDARDQVVAQQDGESAGGALPTTDWRAGETVVDRRAVPIPAGTPPGSYRLIAALYDAESGERLRFGERDMIPLGEVTVGAQTGAAARSLLPLQHRVDRRLGSVTLLGYDQYARGAAHAPQTPLRPGDLLHLTLYWQAPDPLPAEWSADQAVTITLGDESLSAPLAGGNFPTGEWMPGALLRGEFDIPWDGRARRATLEVSGETIRLAPLP